MMKTPMKKFLLFLALGLIVPVTTFAHGTQVVGSIEQDGYVVTMDAIVPALHAEQPERLNFELEKKSATSSEASDVSYTDVWMRITNSADEVFFTGNITRAPEGLVTGFSFRYPAPGVYEVTLRFLNDDQVLTEASFPITILPNENKTSTTVHEWMFIVGAFGVGVLVGVFLKLSRKRE
jgi:hypothetical protein